MWYYTSAGQQMGPVEEVRLKEMFDAGTIQGETLVWRQGMDNWKPYNQVFLGAPSTVVRYGGFWVRVAAVIIDTIIIGVASSIVQAPLAMMTGIGVNPAFRDPDFSRGFPLPMMAGAFATIWLLGIAIDAAYHVYFWVTKGATPGKMALGLKVVRTDGQPISVGLALGRWVATYVSMFTLCIGYIIAAFDGQKRTLHDHICDTRVIRISA